MNDEQDIPIEDVEKVLKNLSKEYKDTLYKYGELQEECKNEVIYVFIAVEKDYVIYIYIYDIMKELRDNDVIAYLFYEDQLEEVINEINKERKQNKKNLKFDNKEPESIFNQILSIEKIKKYDEFF